MFCVAILRSEPYFVFLHRSPSSSLDIVFDAASSHITLRMYLFFETLAIINSVGTNRLVNSFVIFLSITTLLRGLP